MKPLPLLAALLALPALPVLPAAAQEAQEDAPGRANAVVVGLDGDSIGDAAFRAARTTGLVVELELRNLPPDQWVAVHVHETGACDPATGFESAGGHFNPAEAAHGYFADTGPHAGDLPNQHVDADGRLLAQIFAPLLSLDGGAADPRGRAITVHSAADDYASQPSGGAGDRLACGVIE